MGQWQRDLSFCLILVFAMCRSTSLHYLWTNAKTLFLQWSDPKLQAASPPFVHWAQTTSFVSPGHIIHVLTLGHSLDSVPVHLIDLLQVCLNVTVSVRPTLTTLFRIETCHHPSTTDFFFFLIAFITIQHNFLSCFAYFSILF